MAQGAKALEVPVDVDGCWMLGWGRNVFLGEEEKCFLLFILFVCLLVCLFIFLFELFFRFFLEGVKIFLGNLVDVGGQGSGQGSSQ